MIALSLILDNRHPVAGYMLRTASAHGAARSFQGSVTTATWSPCCGTTALVPELRSHGTYDVYCKT
jgi:hypothetical protein